MKQAIAKFTPLIFVPYASASFLDALLDSKFK